MRTALLVVALITAVFPASCSAAASLRSAAAVGDIESSASASFLPSMDASNMGLEEITGVLTECKNPRSLACWNEILKVLDSGDKKDDHDTNKAAKTNVQSIIQHVISIASIVKTLKGM